VTERTRSAARTRGWLAPRALGWLAGLALAAFVAASCSANASSSPTTPPPEDTLTTPPFSIDPPSTDPSTTIVKTTLTAALDPGSKGDDVKRLQLRLLDLRFDPGTPDGVFGDLTAMAVWAYKKLVTGAGPGVDAKVTPELWDRMQDPLGWQPQKQGDTQSHLEVFLPQQVAVLVRNGVPSLITHISTGDGKEWCNNRRPTPDPNAPPDASAPTSSPVKHCGTSITPAGSYRFQAKRDGWFTGYYGDLYKPTFFNGGIAVHGFNSVPNRPASHGCVRIPNHIADYFQSYVRIGDQVFVFDGVTDPDKLGPVPAPADILDPNASTTTTGATTTVAPSTTAKATTTTTKPAPTTVPTATAAPPTTAAPATTTTSKPPGTTTTSKP
jgi:peptidoglycan hydrolase-like protein with peptidoglycan-binding domain